MSKVVLTNAHGEMLFPEEDILISSVAERGIWEFIEYQYIQRNVKPGYKCINVGAHVGYFTIAFSKAAGESGKVFSFEPDPEIFSLLSQNINNMSIKNVSLFNVAGSNKNEKLTLYKHNKNTGDNRVFDPQNKEFFTRKENVEAVKIDDLIDEKIDFILTDCQGWDTLVLDGMSNIIKSNMPTIIFECVPGWVKKLGIDIGEVITEYSRLGYNITVLDSPYISGIENVINFLNKFEKDESFNILMEKI